MPLFSCALAALAATLLVVAVPHRTHLTSDGLLLAAALVVAFAVAESLVLHVEIGSSATTASLTELPLVLGLLWLDPPVLVAVRLLGALLCLGVGRRQSLVKLLFNLSSIGLEVVLALLVVACFDVRPAALLTTWVAVLLACLVSATATAATVRTVIALAGNVPVLRGAVAEQAPGVVAGLLAGTLGLVAVEALDQDRAALAPLLVLAAGTAYAYRGHARLRDRHDRLTSLYGFVRDVSTSAGSDGTVRAVLAQTRELLRAEVAGLVQYADDEPGPERRPGRHLRVQRMDGSGRFEVTYRAATEGDWPLVRGLTTGEPLLALRGSRDQAVAQFLREHGLRDCVLVPVPGQGGSAMALFVGSRRTEHATFQPADLVALEGLAGHAAVALQNGRLVERLTHESRHDALTGLPNRTEFLARLKGTLAPSRDGVAVLLMDLDRFKDVNDTLGHAAGDRLLARVADRLSASLDAGATVARLGGDEFGVVLPGHDAAAGLQVAALLRAVVEQPVDLDGLFVDVGVSIGLAASPDHGTDASVLMRRADIAMYDAKSGAGIAVYDAQRDDSSTSRLALVAQLRTALAEGQFALDYQPQVDGAGRTRRFEALLRWHHPQRGLVPPDDFIPVAERAGLLQDLTAWVLRTALDATLEWADAGHHLGVAINLSPRNLLDAGLPGTVRRELAARGLPAHLLTLEITESTIMAEPERAIATLRQLHDTGVRLSVDDFGTGYSSLAYLKQLPVDEVKIDKTFVKELATDDDGVAIVRAVLALAASLRLDVVAEGVEDEASLRRLVRLGCGLLQGYHIARPLQAGRVLAWLDTHPAVGRGPAVLAMPRR